MADTEQMTYTIPLAEPLIDELLPFWAAIFGEGLPDIERAIFLGSESTYSHSTLYLQREAGQIAGTCFIMQSRTRPALAGFGEVATAPAFRGQGIATDLCRQAVADFRATGGEAFFLGTVNPVAARVYQRLGWRKLAGAAVMVNLTANLSPEEFLVDYFRQPGAVEMRKAGPEIRVPMIPLILTPHDSELLDANVGLYSCRYRMQNSCMGLYRAMSVRSRTVKAPALPPAPPMAASLAWQRHSVRNALMMNAPIKSTASPTIASPPPGQICSKPPVSGPMTKAPPPSTPRLAPKMTPNKPSFNPSALSTPASPPSLTSNG